MMPVGRRQPHRLRSCPRGSASSTAATRRRCPAIGDGKDDRVAAHWMLLRLANSRSSGSRCQTSVRLARRDVRDHQRELMPARQQAAIEARLVGGGAPARCRRLPPPPPPPRPRGRRLRARLRRGLSPAVWRAGGVWPVVGGVCRLLVARSGAAGVAPGARCRRGARASAAARLRGRRPARRRHPPPRPPVASGIPLPPTRRRLLTERRGRADAGTRCCLPSGDHVGLVSRSTLGAT